MRVTASSVEALLASRDPAAFEVFYGRHVESLLGFFARRTHDPELAADLAAETFAAAEDYARIESLAEAAGASALLELLAPDQRDAVRLHVMEERGYGEIARTLQTSETVVRKRVSRGLAAVRWRMGPTLMREDFAT